MKKKTYTLEELLSLCTPDRAHKEIDLGIVGNESL